MTTYRSPVHSLTAPRGDLIGYFWVDSPSKTFGAHITNGVIDKCIQITGLEEGQTARINYLPAQRAPHWVHKAARLTPDESTQLTGLTYKGGNCLVIKFGSEKAKKE